MKKLLAIVGAFIVGSLAIISTTSEAAARLSLN